MGQSVQDPVCLIESGKYCGDETRVLIFVQTEYRVCHEVSNSAQKKATDG